VDTWALERVLERAEAEAKAAPRDASAWDRAVEWTAKARELYKGEFMAGTARAEATWARWLAERLRQRLVQRLGDVGRGWQQMGRSEAAVWWYEQALEVQPTEETVARRLMTLYRHLGRRAEALAVYERCRAALEATEAALPSSETRALHAALQRD
jgi:two-component SAPR family response regulator